MQITELEISDYISPECACKVEDIAKSLEGIADASFNPVTSILTVKHSEEVEKEDIIRKLEACHIKCREIKRKHGMAEMQPMHAMMEAEMKHRFFVSLFLSVPVLLLSPTIQKWFKFSLPRFAGYDFVLLFFATLVVFYGGIVFYRGAVKSLKNKIADMNVLVSIAVLSGYFYSIASTFLFKAVDFYWEISTLVVFLLFGHWMEMKAIKNASGALRELVKLIPPTANLVKGDKIIEVRTEELKPGDIILIRPGEKIPIDGMVIEGESSVNEAMITGEAKPVYKKEGSTVIGGTINGEGSLKVKVTKTGEETALAQIIKLVQQAANTKPKVQKLADRAANYLTIIAIVFASLAIVYWLIIAKAAMVFALTLAITVLVIACPHALGLAIPTVSSISTTLAANNGMLIRNAEALEIAKNMHAIIFDKTGTLTKGEFGVSNIVSENLPEKEVLKLAASIEANSEHVIAKSIVKEAEKKGIKLSKVSNFNAIPGKGAKGEINGKLLYAGNLTLMKELEVGFEEYDNEMKNLSSQGKTLVFLSENKRILGIIALSDIVREESKEAVRELKKLGIRAGMLTGDSRDVAKAVAEELKLDFFFAEVLPEEKAAKVRELQEKGNIVAFVGDGINDAPALMQANIGIAIGSGTDVAIESADIVLIKNNPLDVVKLIKLSRATMRKMKENLVWATGYNALAIPIAAGMLYPFGILLKPELAALIMAASSIIVVTNAILLRREKLN